MTTHDEGRPRPPIQALADAVAECLELCNDHPGYNLPDLLSAALVEIARERSGSWALVAQRSGSWEATHVQALGAAADYQIQPEGEHEEREY